MRGLASMVTEVAQRFVDKAIFRFCYIAEAHARDEWPVLSDRFNLGRGPVVVNQPKTTAERAKLAAAFQRDFALDKLDLVVDVPEESDAFERAYAPWPLRFYFIGRDDRLLWVAEPVECSFTDALVQLISILEEYV